MNPVAHMQRNRQGARRAMTLVELLVASTLALIVLAGTMTTFIAVQRSFVASLSQVNSQGDQNRVFCYLRRDLRGASSVQLSAQGTQLTLTLPAPAVDTMNLNIGAALLSLLTPPQNVATKSTVRYYRQGTAIIREVDGVVSELSSSATQFQCTMQGAVVQVAAGFQPRFTFGVKGWLGSAEKASIAIHLLNPIQ